MHRSHRDPKNGSTDGPAEDGAAGPVAGAGWYGRAAWTTTFGLFVLVLLIATSVTWYLYALWLLPGAVAVVAIVWLGGRRIGNLLKPVSPKGWLVWLLAVAFAVRLACVLSVHYVPSADFAVYHQAGLDVAAHWQIGFEAHKGHPGYRCFLPPGQVFSLGVLYALFGNRVWAAQVLNVIYGSLTVLAVWYLAGKLLGPAAARVGSLLAALMPSAVLGCVLLGAEVPETFWLMSALCFYSASAEGGKRSKLAALACGVCLGIGALIRATFVLLGVPLALHMLFSGLGARKAAVGAAAIVLGTALVVLPWTYRNYRVANAFILISSNGGGNLYSANNDEAAGGYTHSTWTYLFENSPDDATLHRLGMQKAADWIRGHPWRFLKLAARKFALFWAHDKEIAWWALAEPLRDHPEPGTSLASKLAEAGSCGYYVVCFAAAVVGLLRRRRQLEAHRPWAVMTWVFLYFTLVHMVFEAQGKYHFMLMPLVCILAALVVQDTPCGKGLEPLVGRRRPADKPTRGREMTLETPSHLGAGIVILTCAALAAAGLAGCEYISPPPPASQPAETRYNEAYAGALAAVDDFCQAWVKGDAVAGRALLSVRMQRRYPDQLLGDVIAGSGNPRHAAYEIHNGRRLGDGRYAFDVRLFFCYSGVHGDKLESPLEQAIVAQDDAGRWRIDAFPIPEQKAIVEPSQPTLIPSR